jgi:hypothetical protein
VEQVKSTLEQLLRRSTRYTTCGQLLNCSTAQSGIFAGVRQKQSK